MKLEMLICKDKSSQNFLQLLLKCLVFYFSCFYFARFPTFDTFSKVGNDIFQKKRVNFDYGGVFLRQIYFVIGEKSRKEALPKNLNSLHSRNRKPNSQFTYHQNKSNGRSDGGQLTLVKSHVKRYVLPLFKGYQVDSTTMTEILS